MVLTYDLFDDGGFSTIELPIKLMVGSIFECEFGTYIVEERHPEAPESYQNIRCERIERDVEKCGCCGSDKIEVLHRCKKCSVEWEI